MITLQSYRLSIGIFDTICKKSSSKIKCKPSKINISIYLFIFSFILINTATSYDNYIQKSINKVNKAINGNISKNGSLSFSLEKDEFVEAICWTEPPIE